MKNYIIDFCKEFTYPDEAKNALVSTYEKIIHNQSSSKTFCDMIYKYEYKETVFPALDKISEETGTNKYTVHLLYYICLSKQTRVMYEEKNIPYNIFYDSMCDLKWKLFECHKVKGVWGSFVAWWFPRFFDLTRFALGRLQFETITFDRDLYSKNGYEIKKGDTVLNVHIPSAGPFPHEQCIDSYNRAREFYKVIFGDKPTVFVCSSWLLFPKHKEILPENSNIRKFMEDYDIIESSDNNNFKDMWRIFNKDFTGNVDDLPSETSLQKIYKDYIRKGNTVGSGFGVLLFDGNVMK